MKKLGDSLKRVSDYLSFFILSQGSKYKENSRWFDANSNIADSEEQIMVSPPFSPPPPTS